MNAILMILPPPGSISRFTLNPFPFPTLIKVATLKAIRPFSHSLTRTNPFKPPPHPLHPTNACQRQWLLSGTLLKFFLVLPLLFLPATFTTKKNITCSRIYVSQMRSIFSSNFFFFFFCSTKLFCVSFFTLFFYIIKLKSPPWTCKLLVAFFLTCVAIDWSDSYPFGDIEFCFRFIFSHLSIVSILSIHGHGYRDLRQPLFFLNIFTGRFVCDIFLFFFMFVVCNMVV